MTLEPSTTWVGDRSAQVILAFDFDGPTGDAMIDGSIWRRPGYFSFGAFDGLTAVPRILDILRSHGVSATFFTPAWVVRTWPELCCRILAEGHEIAGHGDIHEMFWGKSRDDQAAILRTSQQTFREILGQQALGFRAPSGDLAPETPELLLEYGYTYSSSFRGADAPYFHEHLPLVEVPAKSLFDDYSVFAYTRGPDFPGTLDRVAPYAAAFRSWREEIDAAADEGLTVATIWHPKVMGTAGRAVVLDEFIGSLAARDDLRILRADQVVAEFVRSNSEQVSAQ
ncbi:polysaccharide deacetylase family protein [Propionimicrobium sp. PCR01-08-3]|uniref:polysaccharide deacetylase family protein n=1 Tax=Propionimicrobium sp. PCR01-08-3 TaxID=3052086 RepID=UPI00255C90F8|nr:polysaccharide deacetylase family protein [Propionimicrobium sp. PCR01-08-3]WIY83981.1 polysaccharide deacetylase family protein [Propionimicrobium sp. PCR01-08-3]